MKKILFFAICMVALALNVNAQTARCVLQHKNNVSLFESTAIATALEAAVDGDTLFLTEGNFPGFTLNKQVTVRGAGQSTRISNNIVVSLTNGAKISQTLLEGFYLSGSITLSTEMDGVIIKQCNFGDFAVSSTNSNMILDKCMMRGTFNCNSKVKGLTCINSKLYYFSGTDTNNACTFVNCNIYEVYQPSTTKGTFINSILYTRWTSGDYKNGVFKNCLLPNWTFDSSSLCENIYKDNGFSISSTTLECSYDAATLSSKGYLGNDGSIVGCYGGTTPFTLELAIPKVTQSTIKLDSERRAVNVTMKVSVK